MSYSEKYSKLREESLKLEVSKDFFSDYNNTIIDDIDLVITKRESSETLAESFLWAEAKKGKRDILESFIQLILTIGKAKTFEEYMPPKYLGAFDAEQFAFIEYHKIMHIFSQNDFNWKVTPSNHKTKEFKQLLEICKQTLEGNSLVFRYDSDSNELKKFIKNSFSSGHTSKITVGKNNFVRIFQKWNDKVKDTIAIPDGWENFTKEEHIMPRDFFLADLISEDNKSLKENLTVVLQTTKYRLNNGKSGFWNIAEVYFNDDQKAHKNFWSIYERPPKEEYWDYIISRNDLLVPSNIREIEGSYFTPKIWVEKSQQYLADVLGEDWQDEYYIWDCCAGTGNLLSDLVNGRNIFASTLIQSDVNIMKDTIGKGLNLFENHIFQFDFLNDDFVPQSKGGKLPDALYDIINDPEERKKLIVYINPPYAEGDARTGKGRSGVAISKIRSKYGAEMGYAKRELFIQFMFRINKELHNCILGQFSKLKALCAPKFIPIRQTFQAKLKRIFLVPADTFDNVKGEFPIAFHIWNTGEKEPFTEIEADVFDSDGTELPPVTLINYDGNKFINDWTLTFIELDKEREKRESIANIIGVGNDFQNQTTVVIENPNKPWNHKYQWQITKNNVLQSCIYLAVRHCIPATWLNDREQFLYPIDDWKEDLEFQSNCLIFTLFHGQNRISTEHGLKINNWIPFTEEQTGCRKAFKSHFMSDFLAGKFQKEEEKQGSLDIFKKKEPVPSKIVFSEESKAVYDAGLEIWKYYHSQKNANPDASLYDIRKH